MQTRTLGREIRGILRHEWTRYRHSAVVLLGVALFVVFLASVLVYVSRIDFAAVAGSSEGLLAVGLLAWLIGEEAMGMVPDASPPVVLGLVLLVWFVPLFAMLFAADQTASDISRRHVRFLLPRVSRGGIYFGRLLGGWLSWSLVVIPSVIVGVLVLSAAWPAADTGADFVVALQAALSLSVYGVPFCALMAFCNTFAPNGFLSLLIGLGAWIIIGVMSSIGALINPDAAVAAWLFPSALKYHLLGGDTAAWLLGLGLSLVYAAVFAALGLMIFRSRDL